MQYLVTISSFFFTNIGTSNGFLKFNFLFLADQTRSPVTDLEVVQTGQDGVSSRLEPCVIKLWYLVTNIIKYELWCQIVCLVLLFLCPAFSHKKTLYFHQMGKYIYYNINNMYLYVLQ